jgi:TolB-like protein/Flp pilus assembly protein TadD
VSLLGVAVVICLSALGVWSLLRDKRPVASPEEIRLVVLPFDHVGPVENAWFADTVSSEIADRLSGVHGLAVIARHSAVQCKKREMTTEQIGQNLNVDYILEGTVQCEDSKDPNSTVKLRLQLIETASDTQIWSHPFDRDRRQFFALQSEVVEQVARQLDILLLEQDRTWSDYIPTDSTEAHNFVLQGKAAKAAGTYHDAIPFYRKAIDCDPNYVKALGELAWAQTHTYWFEDRSLERLAEAWSAASRAFTLLPDHPWVHVVMARYYYQGRRDYDKALEHLEKARELHPNYTWMLYWTHAVQRRKGDFEEAVTSIERACELDPLSAQFASYAGTLHEFRRDYPKAKRYYEQANLTDPNWAGGWELRAWLQLLWHGDLATARDVMEDGLKRIDPATYPGDFHWLMVTIDIWDGRYQEALDRVSEGPEAPETSIWHAYNALQRAEIYEHLDNKALAEQSYESARAFLEDKVDEHPDVAEYHSLLGRAYAGLGDKEKALEHGELGTKLLPVTKDAPEKSHRVEDLARIYVMVGKHELAIEQLDYLLSIPSRFSRQLLHLDPTWKPLQKYPRFQQLVESGS